MQPSRCLFLHSFCPYFMSMLWKIVVVGDVCNLCESQSHQVWLIVEYFDHVHMHDVDGLVFFHKIFKFFFQHHVLALHLIILQ